MTYLLVNDCQPWPTSESKTFSAGKHKISFYFTRTGLINFLSWAMMSDMCANSSIQVVKVLIVSFVRSPCPFFVLLVWSSLTHTAHKHGVELDRSCYRILSVKSYEEPRTVTWAHNISFSFKSISLPEVHRHCVESSEEFLPGGIHPSPVRGSCKWKHAASKINCHRQWKLHIHVQMSNILRMCSFK